MEPLKDTEILKRLKEVTAVAEKNEETITRIKKNLDQIKKKPNITEEDSRELQKNYELLKQELINQEELTKQLHSLTTGVPCDGAGPTCPGACTKQNDLFMPQAIVCGNADDIIPRVIVWNQYIYSENNNPQTQTITNITETISDVKGKMD